MVSPAGTASRQAGITAAPQSWAQGRHPVLRATRTFSPYPGFGIPTITATRILKAQEQGKLGPETPLALDAFPYVALSKVNPCHAGHGVRVMLGMGSG